MANPQKSPVIDAIAKHAATRGVTIFLDGNGVTLAFAEGKKFHFDSEAKRLTIVPELLTADEEEAVLEIVRTYFNTHELVLDAEQEEIFESYQSYTEYNPYADLIQLFTGKIPVNDLNALKMSLFMKIQKERGENIEDYKEQIRNRFGSRGAYIANLCKAGYYETSFKSKCLLMRADKFSEYYELRVGNELAALFVHSGLTMASMKKSFAEKVSGCLLNGIGKFRVLGFGRKNVELIEQFILQTEDADWGADIEWVLKLQSPPPHSGLEYDIIIP